MIYFGSQNINPPSFYEKDVEASEMRRCNECDRSFNEEEMHHIRVANHFVWRCVECDY